MTLSLPLSGAADTKLQGSQDSEHVELIARARRRDPTAWRKLFAQHHRTIVSICVLATDHHRETALDLTQDTFVQAFESLHQLRDPTRFRAWLCTIALNRCRRHAKISARHQRTIAAFFLHLDAEPPAEDKALRRAREEVVRQVIDRVPEEKMRQIARLKYTHPEHTTRQIAQKLGVPHGTVTVTLQRFRKRFKEVLVEALAQLQEEGTP